MPPLNDDDLRKILQQWKAPDAPPSLQSRLRANSRVPWWQWLLWGKVQVPVPVGALAVILVAVLSVFAFQEAPEPATDPVLEISDFQLADDLNPRIIRSSYEND